jgi:GDPmannose 4,6-dehydratase
MRKKALITGITGQDAAYLAKFLLGKGYGVFGTFRRVSSPNFWRLQCLGIFKNVKLLPVELADSGSIFEAVTISKPDEIYHLAAQSFVGTSFNQPIATADVTGLAVARFLEAVRHADRKIKFYQASTSELYGNGNKSILTEASSFNPTSPYAAAKLYGYWMTKIYREGYGIFAVNGILFNHESPLRGMEFVTRKISNAVAKIALGLEKELRLGNLDARRDWGYSPDYVESMWMMLQQKEPDDYVIATGEAHSVKEFVELAFREAGLNWKKYVKVDKRLLRPVDTNYLCGDFTKAKKKLGWKPKVTFEELVALMVREDLMRWRQWQKGEQFPWDAANYPGELNAFTRLSKNR